MSFYIRKYSGEKQRFDLNKFRRSLLKAGASPAVADDIVAYVESARPKSTKDIHALATQLLLKKEPFTADRYNLKQALAAFGPHGYPFEKFIGHLFSLQGYTTQTNIIVPGFCVHHEVDVAATKNNHFSIVECKFHTRFGLKSDVKVALYVYARFKDIEDAWHHKQASASQKELHHIWLVTNTKFTSEAIKYGTCKKMRLLGWSYPEHESLPTLIERYNLFPITTLTSLNKYQKRLFLKNDLVLCKDAKNHEKKLKQLGLSQSEVNKIIQEAEAVCNIN